VADPDELLVEAERVVPHTRSHRPHRSMPVAPVLVFSRSRITTVPFRHTILERMLGSGTLVVESASDDPLELADIPAVERVHALLYQEVADDD